MSGPDGAAHSGFGLAGAAAAGCDPAPSPSPSAPEAGEENRPAASRGGELPKRDVRRAAGVPASEAAVTSSRKLLRRAASAPKILTAWTFHAAPPDLTRS